MILSRISMRDNPQSKKLFPLGKELLSFWSYYFFLPSFLLYPEFSVFPLSFFYFILVFCERGTLSVSTGPALLSVEWLTDCSSLPMMMTRGFYLAHSTSLLKLEVHSKANNLGYGTWRTMMIMFLFISLTWNARWLFTFTVLLIQLSARYVEVCKFLTTVR